MVSQIVLNPSKYKICLFYNFQERIILSLCAILKLTTYKIYRQLMIKIYCTNTIERLHIMVILSIMSHKIYLKKKTLLTPRCPHLAVLDLFRVTNKNIVDDTLVDHQGSLLLKIRAALEEHNRQSLRSATKNRYIGYFNSFVV